MVLSKDDCLCQSCCKMKLLWKSCKIAESLHNNSSLIWKCIKSIQGLIDVADNRVTDISQNKKGLLYC